MTTKRERKYSDTDEQAIDWSELYWQQAIDEYLLDEWILTLQREVLTDEQSRHST